MPMAVFCIATSEFEAEAIVVGLKGAGFDDNAISVLFPDRTESGDSGPKPYSGNILIAVQAVHSRHARRAKEIFNQAGAHDIAMTNETASPEECRDQNGMETHALA